MPGHIMKLPCELVAKIMWELPQDQCIARTMSKVCSSWRDAFHLYNDEVKTFPATLPDGLEEDAYYISYWSDFKARCRCINTLRVVWVVPGVTKGHRWRLTRLLGTFIDMFPTETWKTLHMYSFPWDAVDNTTFAKRVLSEEHLTFPALVRVKVSGRLEFQTNLLLRAIDKVSTRESMPEFETEHPIPDVKSYPRLSGFIW
ncbi:hypothetical protein CPB86DRAFT_797304 [Serendipita vermifera]|nr:hypothetical protein CPB86DRAFT_797304 [Serendipita vermifera]